MLKGKITFLDKTSKTEVLSANLKTLVFPLRLYDGTWTDCRRIEFCFRMMSTFSLGAWDPRGDIMIGVQVCWKKSDTPTSGSRIHYYDLYSTVRSNYNKNYLTLVKKHRFCVSQLMRLSIVCPTTPIRGGGEVNKGFDF